MKGTLRFVAAMVAFALVVAVASGFRDGPARTGLA